MAVVDLLDPSELDEGRLGSVDAAFERHNELYMAHITDAWGIVQGWLAHGPVIFGRGEEFYGFKVPPLWNLGDRPSAMALSYQSIVDVLDNPAQFAADLYETPGGRTLIHMDGDEHRLYRVLLLQVFSPKAIRRWESELVGPVIEDLLDELGNQADLVPTLFRGLSPRVFALLCGLPLDQLNTFSAWAMWQFFPHDPMGRAGAARLNMFLREQVAKVRALPKGELAERYDLISVMVKAEVEGFRPSDDEIAAAIQIIIIGGTDTVGRSMSAIGYYLFTEPGLLDRVKADRSLLPAVIEESLRLCPPNTIQGRLAIEDREFYGVQIKAGTPVMINQLTGNRDPTVWDNPHLFSIDRAKQRTLIWGTGPHACVGMHLARTEMTAAFNRLFDRYPNIRLDPDSPPPSLCGFGFRAPLRLDVLLA